MAQRSGVRTLGGMRGRARTALGTFAGAGAAMAVLGLAAGPAWADSASDPRATFHDGNVTTCSDVNLPNDVQAGSNSASSFSDGIVSGTVTNGGQDLQVSVLHGVTVDAVVVKGGNGYNVYTQPKYLPPTLASPQNYISALNNGGNIPTISHWFVCYGGAAQTPVGMVGGILVAGALAGPLAISIRRNNRRRRAAAD